MPLPADLAGPAHDLTGAPPPDLTAAPPDLTAPPDLLAPADLHSLPGVLKEMRADIPMDVDLTAEGKLDWVHWGLTLATDIDRKASNNSALITATIPGATQQWPSYQRQFSWTDGTPNQMVSQTTSGVYITTAGTGFTITVPADTNQRVLRLYLTQYQSTAGLRAHLSDGSAPDYTETPVATNNNLYYQYTFTYRAASANQTLTIGWALTMPSMMFGSVDLLAATLSN